MTTMNGHKRAKIYERDGNKCVWCGSTENLTLDHVVPSSQGGTDAMKNLQTLCEECNGFKGALELVPSAGETLHDRIEDVLKHQIRHHGPIKPKEVGLAAARVAKVFRLNNEDEDTQLHIGRLEAELAGIRHSVRNVCRAKRKETERARGAEELLKYALRIWKNDGEVHSGWIAKADEHLARYRSSVLATPSNQPTDAPEVME